MIKFFIGISIFLIFLLFFLWFVIARPTLVQQNQFDRKGAVDKKLLETHVRILSEKYSPRNYQNIENLNAVANYIKKQFEGMGGTVQEQKYIVDGDEYKNIIVALGPSEGAKIIVGAHYDVAGPYPGADDNASGIAGLIEVARQLKDKSLKTNITLVAYTLEEPPYFATSAMGSYIHAENEKRLASDIKIMLSLEMIGYYSELEDSQHYPLKLLEIFYPNQGNFIAIVDQTFSNWGLKVKRGLSKYMSVPVYSINAPSIIPGVDFSDHRNYWKQGYDAVMITDTSFYRNMAYHTENDVAENLNYNKMAEVVYAVSAYIENLSNEI